MSIQEVIAKINKLKPNTIDDEHKVEWLSKLDGLIYVEMIKNHRASALTSILPNVKEEFTPYDENNTNDELLVPYAFNDLYLFWLEAQMNYWLDDIVNYNKAMTRFGELYASFGNWFNRNVTRDK